MLCALLWGFITAMSYGLPAEWCAGIDRLTLGLVGAEAARLANGFHYDVSNKDMPTLAFLFIFGIIFILVFIVSRGVERKVSDKHTLLIIVFFSILFRLIALPGVLIHENDIYRYLWDGKASLQGINPYKYAPADLFMYENGYRKDYYDSHHNVMIRGRNFTETDEHNLEVLLRLRGQNPPFYERIGHWEVPTIYPPVAQMLFILPVLIDGDNLIWMKALFVIFDIASLFLIIGLLKHFRIAPCMSIIYGWSPLMLFEIANGGHYDAIPIFFALLSLFLFFKRKRWAGTLALAFSALSKFFAGIFLPILVRPRQWRLILFFVSLMGLFYVPYIVWDGAGLRRVFRGLMTYNSQWSYNASVFNLIHFLMGKIHGAWADALIPAKIATGCLYIGVWSGLVFKRAENDLAILNRCFWAVALLFIINPVGDPWYFCWVVPFLCFFPWRSWHLLSGLLMLSYLNFRPGLWVADRHFFGYPLIGWVTYLPFFLYFGFELFKRKSVRKKLLNADDEE